MALRLTRERPLYGFHCFYSSRLGFRAIGTTNSATGEWRGASLAMVATRVAVAHPVFATVEIYSREINCVQSIGTAFATSSTCDTLELQTAASPVVVA